MITNEEQNKLINELRNKIGCGRLDAKKALSENDWDIERAIEWLIKKAF